MSAATNNHMILREMRLGGAAIQVAVPPNGVQLGLVIHDQDAGCLYFCVLDALDRPGWQRCCCSGPTGLSA